MQPHRIFSAVDWVMVNIISGVYLLINEQFILSCFVGVSVIFYNVIRGLKKWQDFRHDKLDRKYVEDMKSELKKDKK